MRGPEVLKQLLSGHRYLSETTFCGGSPRQTRLMFSHMANVEAATVAHNVMHGAEVEGDFNSVPHAVYSHPQIASIGLKEEEARQQHKIAVGTVQYSDIAKGEAMLETDGFAKAIVDAETEKILDFISSGLTRRS